MDEICQPAESSSTLNALPSILPANNGTSSNDEEEDNNSDLDMDIVQLSRRDCSQSSEAKNQPSEITLADDSDHQDEDITEDTGQNSGHYGLRRRRAGVSYKDLVQSSDDEKDTVHNVPSSSSSKKSRKSKFRDVLDLCSLLHNTSTKQLNKFIKNPEIIENLSIWNITMSLLHSNDFHDEQHLELFQKFVQKCAGHVNHLVLICDDINRPPSCWSKVLKLLTNIFKHATFLKQFSMRYHREESNRDQVIQVLNVIGESGQKSLNSLKLLCLAGEGGEEEDPVITKEELDLVVELAEDGGGISWVDVELGDGLLVTQDYGILKTLERLLEVGKDSLESVTIHGGLKGHPGLSLDKSKLRITFPRKMSSLRELTICPKYNFISDSMDTKNPSSKRWREIRLDDVAQVGGHDELNPLKLILVLDQTDFPVLEKVVLGNLIELEECGFSLLRKLKIFRCGSRWDLAVRFPQTASKKGSSQMKEMQLPDGLKDSSFVQKVGKFFPLLRKVWIYLPSVPVLRTFFKSYENSTALEELYIKTQFDFETTLESCLLPGNRDERNSLSDSSKTVLRTLKEYKHFTDYARYHNIELPLEDTEDLSELRRSSAGIQALKSLQVLDLEHIPRTLLIPNPEDERRWYDHNFKYLNTTFGFRLYPYSKRCHKEILGLNLREYHWRNLQFLSSRSHFDRAGYVAMDYVDLMSSGDEDDLSIPIPTAISRNKRLPNRMSTSRGIKVAIKPSMLIPDHWKSKTET